MHSRCSLFVKAGTKTIITITTAPWWHGWGQKKSIPAMKLDELRGKRKGDPQHKWWGKKPSSTNSVLVGLNSFKNVIKFLKYMDKGLGGNLSAYEVMWKNFYEVVTSSKSNHTPPLPLSSSYYVIVETMGADQEKDSVLFEKLLETALESNIIQDAVVPHSESERAKLWP